MSNQPLRSISISDFRRLSGHRTLSLDAPIVLIHGPNGTGKTSILAALEMGLTGQIRSMRRQDPRYTAYLPFLGQDFATVRVDVDEKYAAGRDLGPVTVGGSRIDGQPALNSETAAFFAERCYLDQVSLGQLLELYQYREGKEESALARFVNELLGLEQLDALRSGLDEANDLRNLKHLSRLLDQAAENARLAGETLNSQTQVLQRAGNGLTQARANVFTALREIDPELQPADDEAIPDLIEALMSGRDLETERVDAALLEQRLVALGGRVAALLARPSTTRLGAAETQLAAAEYAIKNWEAQHGATVLAVQQLVEALGTPVDGNMADFVDEQLRLVERELERQEQLARNLDVTARAAEVSATALADLTARVEQERDLASNLVEGLAAIGASLPDGAQVCPVCDRDFAEVSSIHLGAHIQAKLAELTDQGQRLLDLRAQREAAQVEGLEVNQALARLRASVLPNEQRDELVARQRRLSALREQVSGVEPLIAQERSLMRELHVAQELVTRLQEEAVEAAHVDDELETAESLLRVSTGPEAGLSERHKVLARIAGEQLQAIDERRNAERNIQTAFVEFRTVQSRVAQATQEVANAAQAKQHWESRVEEGRRRQRVARDVHAAAGRARTAVVQHVFTESLNQVWGSVFSRLAPREHFIPSFGIPTATKAALELTLQTTHVSGEAGGSPQMMLSAGNLNTAALSLFLALHLAVEPVVPCLVFDDPVQAMDEVHVAQFAGLIRTLSKHHGRQVVIAVHERELFEYLSLELSPAYEGDELITIELGDRELDGTELVTKRGWTPDLAIAT